MYFSADFKLIGIDDDVPEGWHLATARHTKIAEVRSGLLSGPYSGSVFRVVEYAIGGQYYGYNQIYPDDISAPEPAYKIIVSGNLTCQVVPVMLFATTCQHDR